jgi:hypothetical protein
MLLVAKVKNECTEYRPQCRINKVSFRQVPLKRAIRKKGGEKNLLEEF